MSGIIGGVGSRSGIVGSTEIPGGYEVGTFTLDSTSGSGSGDDDTWIVLNGSYNTGEYTKIGRAVHVQGAIYVSSVSLPTGDWSITGLPFTSGSGTQWSGRGAVAVWSYGLTATVNAYYGEILGGGTSIYISEWTGSTNASMANHVQAGTYCSFSATYNT